MTPVNEDGLPAIPTGPVVSRYGSYGIFRLPDGAISVNPPMNSASLHEY